MSLSEYISKGPRVTVICILAAFMVVWGCDVYADRKIRDMEGARDYCDREELDRVEGIWEFPEDETIVLIRKSAMKEGAYWLVVISSPDCRLKPGEILGKIEMSADADKYFLSLYSNRKAGILTDMKTCRADFNEKEGSIFIFPKKYKIGLRSLWLLPKFWRMIRIGVDNPADKIPRGLIRIYPGAATRNPVYL